MGEPTKRSGWVTLLLVLLPLWLIGSGGGALWFYFHREKQLAQVEQERFARAVSIPMLEDDLRKLVEVIGERNGSSETAGANLSRTASMIEGLLGPSNTGYAVKLHKGPADWPILQVTIGGKDPKAPAVWVVTSYDSRTGSRGSEANATGLASTLAAAEALASEKPAAAIQFIFIPHANEADAKRVVAAAKLSELVNTPGGPKALLFIESMGGGEALRLSSREASPTSVLAAGLGTIHPLETAEGGDFTSLLADKNLPAVRVSTRVPVTARENDEKLPFAPTVAASTGRLIELIRRCAGIPAK